MLGFLMNRWVLGGLAGLVMLGFSFWKGYTAGKENIQQKWDAEKVIQEREMLAKANEAIEKERQLQAKADKIQKERIRESQIVNRRYNALVDSLRDRPEGRASEYQLPDNPGDVLGCTGEGLAKPDAEFLAGYAADAARLQAAYDSCKAAYEVIYEHGRQK